MKNVRRIFGLFLVLSLAVPGYTLVIKSGDMIEIGKGEVIDDDLIVFAQKIIINGQVNGDVCAFGRDIMINGDVYGTIASGGADINIDVGNAGTIWAAGGEINVAGDIDKNVLLFGGELCVSEDAAVGKDLRAFGGKFEVDGNIDGTIRGSVGSFTMAGTSGDISINADKIRVKSGAEINGDLILEGEADPTIEEGALITGETRVKEAVVEEKEAVAFALAPFLAFFITFMKIVCFIAKIIVGVILIALFGKFVRRIMDTLIGKPWPCLGWGFLGLVVIPIAVMILFVILVGFPFAILGIYIYTILFYLSSIFVGLVVGEKIIQLFKKEGEISQYLSLIVGLVVLLILGFIPILGFIIKLAVLLFGTGMLLLGSWHLLRAIKEKELI